MYIIFGDVTMVNRTIKTQHEIYSDFYIWLCQQPAWLKDAAWRIYNNKDITNTQIDIYTEMCLKEIEKESVRTNLLNESDIVPQKKDTTICINKLFDINGVNALSTEANLTFNSKGVTVIYGLNGAGKSGYMRIFKQVCNHHCAEKILPNIFNKNTAIDPTCKFNVTLNDQTFDVFCNLEKNNEQTVLKQCDAFDTKISTSYLVNKNNVSYEPFVFTVLSKLSETAGRIEQNIQSKISLLNIDAPILPEEFSMCESLNWYNEFSYKTNIPEMFLSWSENDESQLIALQKLNNKDEIAQRLKLSKIKLENLKSAKNEFENIDKFYKDESSVCLKKAYEEFKSSENKLKLVESTFYNSAAEEDQISINSSEWKELWGLAKKYYESVLQEKLGKKFADVDSICPLCHQVLAENSHKRFISVDNYINGQCLQEFKNKTKKINDIFSELCDSVVRNTSLKVLLSDSFEEDKVRKMCDTFYSFAKIKEKNNVDEKYELCKNISISEILFEITEKIIEFSNESERLSKLIETEEQKKLEMEIISFKGRKWIYDNLDDIQAVLNDSNKMHKYSEARKLIKTNKITAESNILANELITESYIQRFSQELKQLASSIKVKIQKGQSVKGKTPYQVVLETEQETKSRTIDILSEGEQRIVALAAFFADATGRNECTPIIIDDPISSLDSRYEQKATRRIAELAQNRQVIVFTHRISFLVGLIDECKNLDVKCTPKYIRSAHSGKGLSDFENVYHGKLTTQLNGLINDLEANKKRDIDSQDYINCKDRTCQQFRICVERSVEEVLLFGMVKRFNKVIMTNGKLKNLLKIEEEDCNIIDSLMTKYSFNEHSQSIDGPYIDYTNEEIIKDILQFKEWIKCYNKKTSTN